MEGPDHAQQWSDQAGPNMFLFSREVMVSNLTTPSRVLSVKWQRFSCRGKGIEKTVTTKGWSLEDVVLE